MCRLDKVSPDCDQSAVPCLSCHKLRPIICFLYWQEHNITLMEYLIKRSNLRGIFIFSVTFHTKHSLLQINDCNFALAMNTQTTRRKLIPEFKAKVVIEALREQATLVDIAKKYEISIPRTMSRNCVKASRTTLNTTTPSALIMVLSTRSRRRNMPKSLHDEKKSQITCQFRKEWLPLQHLRNGRWWPTTLSFHETNGANPIRFNPRKGTQVPPCLLFYLRNACKFCLRN